MDQTFQSALDLINWSCINELHIHFALQVAWAPFSPLLQLEFFILLQDIYVFWDSSLQSPMLIA